MSAECHIHGTDLLGANADYCPSCERDELRKAIERHRAVSLNLPQHPDFERYAHTSKAYQELQAKIDRELWAILDPASPSPPEQGEEAT